jgi:hypothetical protein
MKRRNSFLKLAVGFIFKYLHNRSLAVALRLPLRNDCVNWWCTVRRYCTDYSLILSLSLFLSFSLSLPSCYQARTGCLDPEAANYDVSADDPCIDLKTTPNCKCLYPSLRLNIQPYWKDSTRVKEGFQTNIPFVFLNASFFLTDIQLIKSDGTIVAISDSIKILVKKSKTDTLTKKVKNDIVLVNLKDTVYSAGEIKQTGTFTKLKFRVALNKDANQADLKSVLPNPHPLRDSSMYHYDTFTRDFARFTILKDKTKAEFTTYTWTTSTDIEITFDKPIAVEKGRDAIIKLKILYSEWFKDIDLKQSDATVTQQLITNMKKAFYQR